MTKAVTSDEVRDAIHAVVAEYEKSR